MQNASLQHLYSNGPFLVRWGPPTRATESDDDKAMEWLEKLHGLAKKLDCKVTPSDTPDEPKVRRYSAGLCLRGGEILYNLMLHTEHAQCIF